MAQHFGLDIDLQPRGLDIHVVPQHLRRSIELSGLEIFVRLLKGGDIDLETIESRLAIPDRQRVLDRPDAIQNGVLQGRER